MNKELQQKLWMACESGDAKNVRMALVEGADPDARDLSERNALNIASQHGYAEIYKTVLAARQMARLERLGLPLMPSSSSTQKQEESKKSA